MRSGSTRIVGYLSFPTMNEISICQSIPANDCRRAVEFEFFTMDCAYRSPMKARWVAAILFVVATCSTGCGIFHKYRPLHVVVRDAETKQPLAKVEVTGLYLTMLDIFGPTAPRGTTDRNGAVTLQIGPRPFSLFISEDGYLYTQAVGVASDHLVIDLKPESRPTFVLITPNRYRGLITVKYEPSETIKVEPTKRTYEIPVSDDGQAVVRLPAALCRTAAGRWVTAREINGKRVRRNCNINTGEIGLWPLRKTDETEMYLVGDGEEWEKVRRTPEYANE